MRVALESKKGLAGPAGSFEVQEWVPKQAQHSRLLKLLLGLGSESESSLALVWGQLPMLRGQVSG